MIKGSLYVEEPIAPAPVFARKCSILHTKHFYYSKYILKIVLKITVMQKGDVLINGWCDEDDGATWINGIVMMNSSLSVCKEKHSRFIYFLFQLNCIFMYFWVFTRHFQGGITKTIITDLIIIGLFSFSFSSFRGYLAVIWSKKHVHALKWN